MITLNYASTEVWDRRLRRTALETAVHHYDVRSHAVTNFKKFFAEKEELKKYDLIEFSLSGFLRSSEEFRREWQLLPVATSRSFRFQSGFRLRDTRFDRRPVRIALPTVGMTAGIWIAHYLQRWFGVDYEEQVWIASDRLELSRKAVDRISAAGAGPSGGGSPIFAALEEGAADLVVAPNTVPHRLPEKFEPFPGPSIQFAREVLDHAGGVPIMHMLLLRRELADADSSLPTEIFHLFEEARVEGLNKAYNQDFNRVNFPTDLLDYREWELLAGGDPYSNSSEQLVRNIEICHSTLRSLGFQVERELKTYFTKSFFTC